ncbi:MAG TPA: TIGR00341 family protein [Arcobacter sp.]|nr:TIGR00341 family protein [Arcobacter sp.]HIP55468.1 TIGR00341 family protein [Arcobacter sp.]
MNYTNIKLVINSNNKDIKISEISEYLNDTINIKNETTHFSDEVEYINNTLYLLYLDDNEIKSFFNNNLNTNINIAIIGNDTCPYAILNYAISKDINEALEDALNIELLSKIDLLRCNELIAFNKITIGDMHGMNRINFNEKTKWQKTQIFLRNFKNIKYKSYVLKTSKDHVINTAASGITILEHTKISDNSKFAEVLSLHDGKLNAFILAPTSLLSYFWYLITIFFYQKISTLKLPKSLGFIKTSKLSISSSKAIEFTLDGEYLCSQTLDLEVLKDSINLHLGSKLQEFISKDTNNEDVKDTIKLNSLPKDEVTNILIEGKLPLFKKASDDEFKDLFVTLRDGSKFSSVFLVLMVLSTLLATTGLFASSAPVIIGAMILAPLMSPIISLSMGVVRAEKLLITQSIRTLFIGISTALLFSYIYSSFIPLHQITPEMQGRLTPNLLDLMVAIFSGIAGAYASSKESIAKSLAGVAIAVALVPPLSVTGIGMAFGDFSMIYHSFLLFVTNLVGITLAAALTFIVLGYAPVNRAKKGIFYTVVLLSIITIPLSISFINMVEKNKIFTTLNSIKSLQIKDERVVLNILDINIENKLLEIDIEIESQNILDKKDYKDIKIKIQEKLQKDISLKISSKVIVK